ncbi:hypothetical protein VTK73DRAFT_1928 [Phialemonium thermophilum]|uniref:Uncharacterized protein n=1 Tax=Phialemonium thermophilum TaxID=223376 RepID=A0ABR3X7S1_9PEZI
MADMTDKEGQKSPQQPIAFSPPQDAPAALNIDSNASSPPKDRRMSDEWDASKVPPSRFQKRKGSIYAVPGSRDGHVDKNYAAKYHEKLVEKGWHEKK